ncbi:hypothetical protein MTsPCn9_35360 [Croceitalea sp. MTPC9]|nr:hypothetical protein MTsPCn6_17990 [Croceitalea sp. MTPC6]GMN18596.1 hypothetical protein MTsPCn9_35360 [Croceitalea sp. MTPC9]
MVLVSQTSKQLSGKVIAKDKDVTGVVVQNISNESAVITDVDGNFSIRVSLNDTLVFSAVQFKRKVVPITTSFYNSSFLTVPLEEFVNELREVVVQPFNLSGSLDSDITGLELEKDVSAEALELPNANVKIITQSERKLQEASKGMYSLRNPLAVNINPIINAITGRTKMLKNRVNVDKAYARTQSVQNFYIDSIFMSDLKIPYEKIDDFMYFCEVDSSFQATVDTHDKLKIWEFLIQKSIVYRENNELD